MDDGTEELARDEQFAAVAARFGLAGRAPDDVSAAKSDAQHEETQAEQMKQTERPKKKRPRVSLAAVKAVAPRPELVELEDATAPDPALLAALVIGGMAWLSTLATMNAAMQLSLPGWVRARGLSVYQLVFMGGQAIGSLLWGLLAGATSSVTALLVSAVLLVFCAVSDAGRTDAGGGRCTRGPAIWT